MHGSIHSDVPARVRPLQLDALTSLRFFAALSVVFFHVGFAPISKIAPPIALLFNSGYVAVGFFYVLSGFVLAYNYLGQKIDHRSFYAARLARLYPAYFLALALALPIFLWKAHGTGEYSSPWFAASLAAVPAMLQAWLPQTALAWNTPAWSISVECFFYLLFPLLLPWIGRRSMRACFWLATAMWIAAVLPSLLYVTIRPDGLIGLTGLHQESWIKAESSGWLGAVNFLPLLRLPEFVAGVALGCAFRRDERGKFNAFCYLGAGVLSILAILWAVEFLPQTVPYPIVHNGLLLPLWCVLIYSFAVYQAEGGKLRLLTRPWLVLLGESSYGIYILQQPISGYVKLLVLKLSGLAVKGDYPNLPLLLLYSTMLCCVSVLSFYWFEVPMRAWLRCRLNRRPDAQTVHLGN